MYGDFTIDIDNDCTCTSAKLLKIKVCQLDASGVPKAQTLETQKEAETLQRAYI